MYSYEERLKAVRLYIQYDKSYASVFRELGYPPSSHSIKLWYMSMKRLVICISLTTAPVSIVMSSERQPSSTMLSMGEANPEQLKLLVIQPATAD